VVVTHDGYDTATSPEVAVPPAVTDLHVAMTRTASGGGGPSGGSSGGSGGTGGSSGGGGQPAGISSAQLKGFLAKLLGSGKGTKIKALLKGVTKKVSSPAAGKLTVAWYAKPKGAKAARKAKPVLIAKGGHVFAKAGSAPLKITVTKAGKALLKHAKSVAVASKGTFTPAGRPAVTAAASFTLKR
jgi:hypothetical protein